jgi:hypothetical protein
VCASPGMKQAENKYLRSPLGHVEADLALVRFTRFLDFFRGLLL